MGKGSGKRTGHGKAEEKLARSAMKHHDFIGDAEPERKEARKLEEERISADRAVLDDAVARELARELTAKVEAPLAPVHELSREAKAAAQNAWDAAKQAVHRTAATPPRSVADLKERATELGSAARAAAKEAKERLGAQAPEAMQALRDKARDTADELRGKAEERLPDLGARLGRGMEALGSLTHVLLAPARFGLRVAQQALLLPATVLAALANRRRTA